MKFSELLPGSEEIGRLSVSLSVNPQDVHVEFVGVVTLLETVDRNSTDSPLVSQGVDVGDEGKKLATAWV